MHVGCMYYDLDLKAKAGSSERKHTTLLWPSVSMHAGKVQDGERIVDAGNHESTEEGEEGKKPSISKHNDENSLLGQVRKAK